MTVIPPPPAQPQGTTAFLLERSLKAIAPHMPDGWQAAVESMLAANPILVKVVRHRKTKYGDQQVTGSPQIDQVSPLRSAHPAGSFS